MGDDHDTDLLPSVMRYPPADISADEFEDWVGQLLSALFSTVQDLDVRVRDRIHGTDGSFVFDATVRCSVGGLDFLILAEAKRHTNSIKRDVVQTLHSKMQSVGAQKGLIVSTSPFQRGALDFAATHGIATVVVTEGRFTFETKAVGTRPILSREEAHERYGLPAFVGHAYRSSDDGRRITMTTVSPEDPSALADVLFGELAEQTNV